MLLGLAEPVAQDPVLRVSSLRLLSSTPAGYVKRHMTVRAQRLPSVHHLVFCRAVLTD
jgi:hypothetical protein